MTVALVAVNHNTSGLLPTLLSGLARQSDPDWKLLVVDNTVNDDEVARLRAAAADEPRCEIVASPSNVGYLAALKVALEHVPALAFDWVALTNMDIDFVDPELIAGVAAKDSATLGALAPSVADGRGSDQNPYLVARPGRWKVARWVAMSSSVTVNRLINWFASYRTASIVRPAGDAERDIYAAHGSCFFLSRAYLAGGGAVEQPHLLFNEELTIAEECRRLGLPVRYVPTLRVVHAEHVATGVWRSRFILDQERQAGRYAWRLLFGHTEGAR